MKRAALILFLASLVAGCATSDLSSRGAMIKVTSEQTVKDYKFLGVVEGSSSLTGVAKESGYRNALNEAMNKAAELGATHLVLDDRSKPRYWSTSIVVRGEAYRAP
jgi:hypothetical protein